MSRLLSFTRLAKCEPDLRRASWNNARILGRPCCNYQPAVNCAGLGLNAAIEWQVRDFPHRSGIRRGLSMEDDFRLDGERATALFRKLRE